jgi:NAD(P)-dependent dehydrogenase (short-subunit alcohol dehydrogenase family)
MPLTVITGTAGGLGRACAEAFVAEGHTVAGLDLGPQEPLAGLHPWTVDITDADSVTSAFDQITHRFGPPAYCLTVAGVYPRSTLDTITPELYRTVFDVNVLGTALVAQAFARTAAGTPGAVLLTVSSVDGITPTPKSVLYSASKAAVVNLTASIAESLAAAGIRVVGVAPGYIATDRVKDLVGDAGLPADAAEPSEIARACLALVASGGLPLVTGQTVVLRRSQLELLTTP